MSTPASLSSTILRAAQYRPQELLLATHVRFLKNRALRVQSDIKPGTETHIRSVMHQRSDS
jgi:hypothetical protein